MAGRFIVFEGLDGANLEHHLHTSAEWLKKRGLPVFETREPTDGPIGRDIRLALRGRLKLDRRVLAVLFAADRLDHLFQEESGIEARLRRGEWVLSDRYYLSHYAYQRADGFELEWLKALNKHARHPDLIFFLDYPIDVCIREMYSAFHYSILAGGEERGERPIPDAEGVARQREKLHTIREAFEEAIRALQGHTTIVIVEASDRTTMQRKISRYLRAFLEEQ